MAPMMKEQRRVVQLFDDLIIGIMARHPPKSILRFRCLSKSWNALLSSSSFIRMHLNHVKESKYNDLQRLILSSTYFLQSMSYEAGEKPSYRIDFPLDPKYGIELLGSCNGLLCLGMPRETLILWNPSIKEFKKLPLSCPLDKDVRDTFGFGYDHSTNDYKIIRIVKSVDRAYLAEAPVDIYSLKSNTWKRIQSFRLSRIFFENSLSGTLVNEILYWNVIYLPNHEQGYPYSDITRRILGFDLTHEIFEVLPPPNDAIEGRHFTLRVIGGCLSLAQNLENLEGDSMEMWKLEKDNMKQSWIKFMTIKNLQTFQYPQNLVPICIMKNGEVVITYSESVSFFAMGRKPSIFELYDPVKDTFRRLKVSGIRQWSRVMTYMESLVSPNSSGM
ncbi:F-box/kelch-repeat protein At3g23880-like [Herrania umbratica]|uniref:F-box/kelch-repeat protein At3g23880-like n=1 Tax=Herrania umbratica TaxID=108875 RepID=A0A6J1AU22_9ROSI|nr:F-box/kelch-repeat protein At3g23880-like [Herrania umbratica]